MGWWPRQSLCIWSLPTYLPQSRLSPTWALHFFPQVDRPTRPHHPTNHHQPGPLQLVRPKRLVDPPGPTKDRTRDRTTTTRTTTTTKTTKQAHNHKTKHKQKHQTRPQSTIKAYFSHFQPVQVVRCPFLFKGLERRYFAFSPSLITFFIVGLIYWYSLMCFNALIPLLFVLLIFVKSLLLQLHEYF